jgi:hypothetical protein
LLFILLGRLLLRTFRLKEIRAHLWFYMVKVNSIESVLYSLEYRLQHVEQTREREYVKCHSQDPIQQKHRELSVELARRLGSVENIVIEGVVDKTNVVKKRALLRPVAISEGTIGKINSRIH